MAKKFFYNKVYNPKKKVISIAIISLSVIGIIICFLITKNLNGKNPKATIELRDSVSVEVNSELPEKTVYFSELQGIKEDDIEVDTDNVDLTKIGDYKVKVTVNNKDYDVTLKVVDNEGPILKAKDYSIKSGETYTYSNFVSSCEDDSKDECIITFATATDQDGNKLDYGSYKTKGTYEIKISAKDKTGNETVKSAKLYIDTEATTDTTKTTDENNSKCKYGNLEYDKTNILAVMVGSDGCAIDLNLHHDENVRKSIDNIANTETKKIQAQVNKISGLQGILTVNRNINAVLNNTNTGLVGYSLYVKVNDAKGNTIVSYYLDQNGNRVFDENPYKLK